MLGFRKRQVTTIQPEKVEMGFRSAGIQHGEENVPVEISGVEVVEVSGATQVKFCGTVNRWRRLSQATAGDGKRLSEKNVVDYSKTTVPSKGVYTLHGLASANGSNLLIAGNFIPQTAPKMAMV